MQKRGDKNLIVGLDIGTSKVVAIVGELNDDGEIEVVGIGSHPSRGLKKGVVVNIETTVGAIRAAVEEAEQMAGCEINTVFAGISGGHPLGKRQARQRRRRISLGGTQWPGSEVEGAGGNQLQQGTPCQGHARAGARRHLI